MNTIKHILITGISSALMQNLVYKFDNDKYRIWGVTRNKLKAGSLSIGILEGDICDPVFVENIIRDKKINIVIHAAAVTHTHDTREYFSVNLQSTVNLVNASKQNDVSRFIFISSRTAGTKSGAYGLSKLQAEEYIKNNLSGWTIIRPSEIFGSNNKEGVDKLIDGVLHKKLILCPVNIKSKLYPIHYTDASQIIFDIISDDSVVNKLITINGKESFSNYELICRIRKAIKKKVYIIPVPKFMMFTLKWFIEVFRIKAGIVPDQISRLYSHKETGLQYTTISIDEYIAAKKMTAEQTLNRQ